jgi:hypothetical protein
MIYLVISLLNFFQLHVHDSNVREVLSGYMKTLPCSPQYDEDYGVYALDCEMVGMTFPPLREKSSSYPYLLGRSG